MVTLESKFWLSTIGIALASQIVNRTLAPVVAIQDPGTVSQQHGRTIYVTGIVEQEPVKRTRQMKFSRAKRRQNRGRKRPSCNSRKFEK